METLAIYIFVLLININLTSQNFAQSIRIDSNQKIEIDHLGTIYICSKDNISVSSENQKKEYQNNFLGDIFSVDVSNPLRILVFHKDANQIVFLNNELSIIGNVINLDEISLSDIATVCASQINGFWVFNNLNNRIEYIDSNLKKKHSSIDLSTLIEKVGNVEELKMYGNRVYLKVENIGILVFDMFATYIKTIPITNSHSFQVLENSILYTQNTQAIIYDFNKLNHTILFHANNPITYARVYNHHLYFLEKNELKSIKLTSIY